MLKNKIEKLLFIVYFVISILLFSCNFFALEKQEDSSVLSNQNKNSLVNDLPGKLQRDRFLNNDSQSLRSAMELTEGDELQPIKTISIGTRTHTRYQFMHDNIPVWGMHVLAGEQNG